MDLKQLKDTVDFTIKNLRDYEDPSEIPVLITLSEPSIGSRAFSQVVHVGMGFDWEHGQFRIAAEKQLVSIGKALTDVKSIVCHPYDGRNYYFCPRCEGKISKDDRYCRYCSQKLR
jgi:hypothetical protein